MRALLAALLGASMIVTGCSDDEPSAEAAASASVAPLPDNLCTEVLGAVGQEWQLAEESHSTEGTSASCALAGPGTTTLRVTLTQTHDPAAALDLACRTVVAAELDAGGRRCELASERQPGQAFTMAVAASYAQPGGVVVQQLSTTDDTVALTAPGVLATVEAALQSV